MQIKKPRRWRGNKKRQQNVALVLADYYTTNYDKKQYKLASGFWAGYIVVGSLGGFGITGDIHW